ncbi:MAG: sensor histidine kinase [Streptosporangiaceae bacterium]
MRTANPQTALQAVTWRRLPLSSWPWRSAGYLLSTLPLAALAAVALAAPAVPWIVMAAQLTSGSYQAGPIAALALLGVALLAAVGPVIAAPLAAQERRRLRFVDARPASSPLRPAPAGLAGWLRARYSDPAAWRETGYACLLATVAPALSLAGLLAVLITGLLIASPFVVLAQRPGSGPVTLGFGQVSTVAQTLPYAVVGVLVLPIVPYLVTLAAGGQAAIARALLTGGPDDQLRAELTEVSRSRARLAGAFEAERRRIERDLHDGAQQKLVALTMQLGLAQIDLPPGSPAAESLATAQDQAKQLMAELRELIHGIQPQVLTDLGLAAAIGELADASPVPVKVDTRLPGRMPGQIENTAYFVVAEALTNVAKHSGATTASITARVDHDLLTVEVSDNGRGGADQQRGTGLTGLADRVAVTGGTMLISSPAGGPTLLRAEFPCR